MPQKDFLWRYKQFEELRPHIRCVKIWPNGHEFEQTPEDSEGQGSLACCSPWGSQRVGHDLVTEQQQQKKVAEVSCY